MFDKIRIVLVNTTHPGNIGAAARALKNMGFSQLYLVKPKLFPHQKAVERAAHAADILAHAVVVDDFISAIKDCELVLGASARARDVPWTVMTARAAAQKVQQGPDCQAVALVFGNEQNGLSNDELRHCHFQIEIPADPAYSSLNLAAAVQVVCYEMRMAWLEQQEGVVDKKNPLATVAELNHFYQHLEKVLFEVGFLKTTRSSKIMQRLRCLFNRSALDKKETKILRGILKAVEDNI